MKHLFTSIISLIVLSSGGYSQIGVQSDILIGQGFGSMKNYMPVHGGMSLGLFYNIKSSPISVGYRWSGNFYANSCKTELPFERDDYVHTVANVSNSHSVSQHVFFTRYELFHNKGISPFVELGGGIANYNSRWSATDPYENRNDDCEGYLDDDRFFRDNTLTAQASGGLTIKFNKLGGRDKCYGTWLTFAVDYSQGGEVKFLNSKLNDAQFYYVPGTTDTPRLRHNEMHGTPDVESTPEPVNYDKPFYNAKHELLQFRIGLTFFIGNCK